MGKMGTTAKMVTQHGKVECSDTKLGTVSMALLQREPLYVFCGLEARSSASGKNVGKTGIITEMVNALIPSKGQ